MDKMAELKRLGSKRKNVCWGGYRPIGDYHEGAYESEYVSPYTKSANNPDAQIMVLLQDWSSDEVLSRPLDIDARRTSSTLEADEEGGNSQ